jgi:hypothetical protein
MNVQGIVKYVFDNRLGKDGSPNKFPNYKFKIGENEIVLWSAIKPSFLEKGRSISVTCQASKKNGSLFVQSKEDKTPMIQELHTGAKVEAKPDTSFNPDELEQELANVAKDFDADLTVETKKPFNKDEFMFTMALLKSGIESSQIGVTKEEIDLKIKDYKFLFQMNFHN